MCEVNNLTEMLELTLDQTAIATTVLANIILSFSIQLQKYAKKRVLHLALHGISTESLERTWLVGLSMLVVAECFYFVALGLSPKAIQMTPIGVFTATSNLVLPQLFFEHHTRTIIGSLLCEFSILVIILAGPNMVYTAPSFDWDTSKTHLVIAAEIVFGIILVLVKRYRPANCSVKLAANCAISSLMGSYAVMAITVMQVVPEESEIQPVLAAIVILSFVLEIVLVSDSLQYFPVWQVVPHHFAMFSSFVVFNSITIFHQFDESLGASTALILTAHLSALTGVWISAKPHLDIPANIYHSGLLPELSQRVLDKWLSNQEIPQAERSNSRTALDTPQGHQCLQEEFGKIMHELLAEQQSPFLASD